MELRIIKISKKAIFLKKETAISDWRRKLQWFGHDMRRDETIVYDIMHGMTEGCWSMGRQNTRMRDIVKWAKKSAVTCVKEAKNRERWGKLCAHQTDRTAIWPREWPSLTWPESSFLINRVWDVHCGRLACVARNAKHCQPSYDRTACCHQIHGYSRGRIDDVCNVHS